MMLLIVVGCKDPLQAKLWNNVRNKAGEGQQTYSLHLLTQTDMSEIPDNRGFFGRCDDEVWRKHALSEALL